MKQFAFKQLEGQLKILQKTTDPLAKEQALRIEKHMELCQRIQEKVEDVLDLNYRYQSVQGDYAIQRLSHTLSNHAFLYQRLLGQAMGDLKKEVQENDPQRKAEAAIDCHDSLSLLEDVKDAIYCDLSTYKQERELDAQIRSVMAQILPKQISFERHEDHELRFQIEDLLEDARILLEMDYRQKELEQSLELDA